VVCRDHARHYLGSSGVVFGHITDPTTLELLACREALALALHLSLNQIIITCDCKTVLAHIKGRAEGRNGTIIREINERSNEFKIYDFIFEGRSLNFDAHNLAKFSSSLVVGRHLWLGAPRDPFVIALNCTPSK
jgi:hypothetical protein